MFNNIWKRFSVHSHFIKCRSKQQGYTILNKDVKFFKFSDIGIRENVGKQAFPFNKYVCGLV